MRITNENEWIDVNMYMPEDDLYVLCFHPDEKTLYVAYYMSGDWAGWKHERGYAKTPVKWQPLPNKPKQ